MFVVIWQQCPSSDCKWTTHIAYFERLAQAKAHYEMVKTGDNFGPIKYSNATLARVIESEATW